MSTGIGDFMYESYLFFTTRVAGIRDFVDSLKLFLMVYILRGFFCFSAEMNFFLLSRNKMCAPDFVSRILFHKTWFQSISAEKIKILQTICITTLSFTL